MMYKSYSYNNMPQPRNTFKEDRDSALPRHDAPARHSEPSPADKPIQKSSNLPAEAQTDDIILLGVILLLLINGCDDKLLLLALVYIFFADYFN